MKRIAKKLLAMGLSIAMIFGFTQGVSAADAEIAATDWMAEVSDDTFLSSVTVPGTHDSGTAYIFPSFFLQCQSLGFYDQLNAGYRYLDIRLALDESEESGTKLKFIHAFGTCKKESIYI